MSFTYSLPPTGMVDQMRLMIGDTNSSSPNFQDEELQSIANVVSGMESGWQTVSDSAIPQNELLLLSCATAMDCLASRKAGSSSGQSVTIGDYKLVGKDQVKALQDIGQRFRDAVNNMPAWGITEENLCGFNEMVIIRNWVLRTEL
jgi:hypothetical protein